MKLTAVQPWLQLVLLTTWCLVLFALSSVSGTSYPQVSWRLADKLVHVLLYFCLGLFAWNYFKVQARGLFKAFMFAGIYGITDEIHQFWVPFRSPSVSDVVADFFGAALAAGAVYLARHLEKNRSTGAKFQNPQKEWETS